MKNLLFLHFSSPAKYAKILKSGVLFCKISMYRCMLYKNFTRVGRQENGTFSSLGAKKTAKYPYSKESSYMEILVATKKGRV